MDGKAPLATGEDDDEQVLDVMDNLMKLPRMKQSKLLGQLLKKINLEEVIGSCHLIL